jgi:hypothetical protein
VGFNPARERLDPLSDVFMDKGIKLLLFSILLAGFVFCTSLPAARERVITLRGCLQETLACGREVLIAADGKNMSEGHYLEERVTALPQLRTDAKALHASEEAAKLFGVSPNFDGYGGNLVLTRALFTWGADRCGNQGRSL